MGDQMQGNLQSRTEELDHLRATMQSRTEELQELRTQLEEEKSATRRKLETISPTRNDTEAQELKRLLHEKTHALRRLENEQEKLLLGYADFFERLSETSAGALVDTRVDLTGSELL